MTDSARPADAGQFHDMVRAEVAIRSTAERVFDVIVDPNARMRWWAGTHAPFRMRRAESDLRIGAAWSLTAEVGGQLRSAHGVYRAIERPRKLTFTWRGDWYADASETLVRFELVEEAGLTIVCLVHAGLVSAGDRAGHQGWPDVLASLRGYIEEQDRHPMTNTSNQETRR